MTESIPLVCASLGERELAAAAEVFSSGRPAGRGPQARALEAELARRLRIRTGEAVAVNDGGDALRLALLGLGVGPGDEVIVADYAFSVPAHAVRRAGAVPVFADVRSDTATVDPWTVADLIGPRTVGVIAADTAGLPADYTELRWITDRHGLFLVEDAACAVGASYKGREAGTLAPVARLSFHGHQGALLMCDPDFAATVRTRAALGIENPSDQPEFTGTGHDHTLSDVAAAILRVQLARTNELLRRRRAVAARYADLLVDDELVSLPYVPQNRCHAWQSYLVTLDPGVDRAAVAAELRARGIGCGPGAWATHLQPVYAKTKHACPVSADLSRRNLALPMHAELTPDQAERVAAALRTALRGHGRAHPPRPSSG
ncbi:DegT/DnrJ/EryC1/StrS aminotransferase family protein [Streptomyces sp. NK15101]|uniref:DegT/DnrJ/EryC1/StrS family aminotransferase n=1 Tax=Streptomyces sp. NK15101 TaxID=2873261 RepID=UPI001CED548A|nr:DegT/DnrJ/EryC1/StrS family aminotransferase [Streptomyces sp. NK15101]